MYLQIIAYQATTGGERSKSWCDHKCSPTRSAVFFFFAARPQRWSQFSSPRTLSEELGHQRVLGANSENGRDVTQGHHRPSHRCGLKNNFQSHQLPNYHYVVVCAFLPFSWLAPLAMFALDWWSYQRQPTYLIPAALRCVRSRQM